MHKSRTLHGVAVVHLLVLLQFGPVQEAFAEESARPWGRIEKIQRDRGTAEQRGGYRGQYNPWERSAKPAGDSPRYREEVPAEAPRYRERSDERLSQPANRNYEPGWQGYGVLPGYPGYYGQGLGLSPNPWIAPLGTIGPSPYYGNYWNDPYTSTLPGGGWPMGGWNW